MIIYAIAGRRPDRPGTGFRRFPPGNRKLVSSRLEALLSSRHAGLVVCSAASGADLIALETAGRLGIGRYVILPFDRARFRETSVIDRPGNWAADYDQIVAEVEAAGNLIELGLSASDNEPYRQTNDAIIAKVTELAGATDAVRVCLIWEGSPRGLKDLTCHLGAAASKRGWPVDEVLTL